MEYVIVGFLFFVVLVVSIIFYGEIADAPKELTFNFFDKQEVLLSVIILDLLVVSLVIKSVGCFVRIIPMGDSLWLRLLVDFVTVCSPAVLVWCRGMFIECMEHLKYIDRRR